MVLFSFCKVWYICSKVYLQFTPPSSSTICSLYNIQWVQRRPSFRQFLADKEQKKKNYFQFLKSPSDYAMAYSAKINVQYIYNKDTYNVPSFYTSSRKVYFLLPCRRRLNIFGDFAIVCLVLVITNPPSALFFPVGRVWHSPRSSATTTILCCCYSQCREWCR